MALHVVARRPGAYQFDAGDARRGKPLQDRFERVGLSGGALSVDQDIARDAGIAAHVRHAFGDREGRKQRHHLICVGGLRPVEEALVVNRVSRVPAVLPRRRRDRAGSGPQKQRDANAMNHAAPILRQAAIWPAPEDPCAHPADIRSSAHVSSASVSEILASTGTSPGP